MFCASNKTPNYEKRKIIVLFSHFLWSFPPKMRLYIFSFICNLWSNVWVDSITVRSFHHPRMMLTNRNNNRFFSFSGSISNIDGAEYHCNKTQVRKVISGVVGAASSVTSIQVANLLRLFKIPQVCVKNIVAYNIFSRNGKFFPAMCLCIYYMVVCFK